MSTSLAVTQLRIAVRDGDQVTLRRLLQRPDLPAIAVELARLAPEIPKPLLPCGTRAAYWRHRDRNEPICPPCWEAERKYNRERNRAVRAGIHVPNRRRSAEQTRWARGVEVDEVAVRRACDGEQVTLTKPERREVVRVLHGRGLSYAEIAGRLHATSRMVHRDLRALGLTNGSRVAAMDNGEVA